MNWVIELLLPFDGILVHLRLSHGILSDNLEMVVTFHHRVEELQMEGESVL